MLMHKRDAVFTSNESGSEPDESGLISAIKQLPIQEYVFDQAYLLSKLPDLMDWLFNMHH